MKQNGLNGLKANVIGSTGSYGSSSNTKYSNWRRYNIHKLTGSRSCYCSDIDFVEWRNGMPKALIEIKSGYAPEGLLYQFMNRNRGFQLELYAKMAIMCKCHLYFVAIEDDKPNTTSYKNAKFHVWGFSYCGNIDKININDIDADKLGVYNELGFAQFIKSL